MLMGIDDVISGGPPPLPPCLGPPPISVLKEPVSKLSPAALRGVSNTTTVTLPPEQALGEAAARAARSKLAPSTSILYF